MKRSELLTKIKDAIFDCEDDQRNSYYLGAPDDENEIAEARIETYIQVRSWIKELTELD